MSEANRMRKARMWEDFTEELPALVREFSQSEINEAIAHAFEDYQDDMEVWEVIGERNSRSKQRELDSGHAVIKVEETA